jgi:hypothetical protein
METDGNHVEVLIEDQTVDIFDVLEASPRALQPDRHESRGALTARFDGFDKEGQPVVSGLSGSPGETLVARTTISLQGVAVGAEVVVLCEHNDMERPIIVGVLQEQKSGAANADRTTQFVSIQADGERQIISAEREIVLRCGDASITLTRAGKILIKGTYVVTRSSGVNRIKGGSVQIN